MYMHLCYFLQNSFLSICILIIVMLNRAEAKLFGCFLCLTSIYWHVSGLLFLLDVL